MNNKSKRILALTSAAAILATSMPITAFAEVGLSNGLEIGPEIGVHSNVGGGAIIPIKQHRWKKYKINTIYSKRLVKSGYHYDATRIWEKPVYSYRQDEYGFYYSGRGASCRTYTKPNSGRENCWYESGYYIGSFDGDKFKPLTPEYDRDSSNNYNRNVTNTYTSRANLYEITSVDYYSDGYQVWTNDFVGNIYESDYQKTKGSYIEDVTSSNDRMYPGNSKSGSYWYVYSGEEVVKTIADQYNSPTKPIIVDYGKTYNIGDGIVDKQPGATVVEVGGPVDTKTSGDKTAKAKITFSDKSTKTVNVTIHVNPSEADNFNNKNKDNKIIHVDSNDPITVVKGEQPNLTDIINEINDKEKNPDVKNVTTPDADTSKPGKGTAKVEVEFNDGSKTTIEVPINVIDTDAAKFKETLQTIIAYKGETLKNDIYKKAITNLPPYLKDFKVVTPLDTSKSAESTAKVSLTFKDDSTKEITLKSKVLEVPKTKTVDWGKELKLTEGVVGLSDKDKVEDITSPAIDTRKSGDKTGKIKVTLESGETRTFEIKVTVKPSEAETNTKIGTTKITVPWGTNLDIKKGITNLPGNATVKDISDTKIDTKKSGNYTAKAEITFADGSTKTVENIPVIVSKSDAENFVPQYKPVEVKKNGNIDYSGPNDFVTNLLKGASVEITNKPSTDKPGTVYADGKIKFKDGSEKDIKIPVIVKEWNSVTYKDKVGIADEHVVYGGTIDITDNLTGEYPKGTTIKDITSPKIDTKIKGDHTGKAKITFPDGTTLEKEYKVIVADPMSDTFPKEANVTKDEQPWGKELDPNKIITNIPEGSTDKSITGINTKQSGEQDGIVKITYPDGSKGEVPVKVTISKSEAENFNPNIKDITVKRTRPADINQPFNNLPDGASVKVDKEVDTNEIGNKTGVVTVTFKDKSIRQLNIPVKVIPLESDTFKPTIEDEIVTWGTKINLKDNIKNLPEGATVEDITNSKIDTKKPGNYIGKVRITFSDKSTKEVEVPVKVQKSEADTFVPEILEEEIVKGTSIDLTDNVKNLPNGATVKDISNPAIDTNKTGKQTAKAEITFADGSKKEIEIPVNVVVTAGTIIPVPGITKENIVPEVVGWGKTINLIDNIKNLPEGATVADITDPEINTKESGDYTGRVEITFKDGSKRRVDIPVKVQKSEAENFNPAVLPEEVVKGTSINLTDNIKNLPDRATVIDISNPAIDTSKTGNQIAKAEITFADGSKKVVEIPVKVVLTAGIITPVPTVGKENILPEIIDWSKPIDLTDNIKNLPDGSIVKDITNPAIDTTKSGEYVGKVEITFKGGSKRIVEIPVTVNKSDAENFKPNMKEITTKREEPADISKPFNNLPDGATVEVKTPVDVKTAGDKTGVVTVTFKDGSKKDFEVPVKVVPLESDEFEAQIETIVVDWGKSLDTKSGIKNLPEGASIEETTQPKVNTRVSGDKEAKAKITFNDKSTQEVTIPVLVNKSESEKFKNKFNEKTDIIEEKVLKGGKVDLTDNIKNLPSGATVTDITSPSIDTNVPGTYNGKAKVTFEDESTMEVNIPVKVVINAGIITPIPEVNNSDIEDENVDWSGKIDLTDNIKNLPDTAKVKDITNPAIDTTKPGTYTGKVEITFQDGSKRIVEVPIEVKKAQSETFTPEINEEKLPYGKEVTPSDIIKNIPDDSNAEFVGDNKIDPTKSGKQSATIKITFADGSTKEYPVEVEIDKSQAEKYKENPSIEPERIPRNGKIDLTDNIKDLPEGSTVVDTTKDKIDTSELGTNTGTVEVTFPDGTKAEFEVPVEVYKTEAEAFGKPITTKEVVNKGGEIDLTDNVVNLPEDAKVIDTTDPKIDTNELGDYTATAKIVFKDGSETEIEIRVVVTDGKIDDTDHSGNDGNISGIITNDTNGSYNGPKDFRFNIKSDGDTPEYKTKSDENSQENKHKALDNLLNGISNLGRRNNTKSNENTTKYVFKIGEKSYKTIHGNNVTSHKMDVAPYIKNDRTMMPLRYVAEAIGANVQWDNDTRTAYFEKDGLVAKIQIDGNKIVMSNGKVYEMDAKPDNINDRILVSITNVSKVFNLTNGYTKDGVNQNIEWNNDNRTVTIVK